MEINRLSSSKKNLNLLEIIILTYNEEIHIERCITSLKSLTPKITVVDSYSTDRTIELAQYLGATVVQHQWKNYADQFQWGLDRFSSGSDWVMRMDADEYLEPDLQEEIPHLLESISSDVIGVYIKRKVFFHGQWIRRGGFYPQTLLRIWRRGFGKVEQRWMDEHIILPSDAKTVTAKGHLVDDNHKGITFWIDKHNNYATREAIDLLNYKYHFIDQDKGLLAMDDNQAKRKRIIKEKVYAKLPLGLRAFLYFIYRYFISLGFLDGINGFVWHFLQGFWYRLLVDIKIYEIEKKSHGDLEIMREAIYLDHGIDLSQ